jgi:hypothetical protein
MIHASMNAILITGQFSGKICWGIHETIGSEGRGHAEIHPSFQPDFGNRVFKKTGVYKWTALVRCGKEDPKDALRSGGPRHDPINEALRWSIEDDAHLSCEALANILNVAVAIVWRHITQSMVLPYGMTR